VLSLATAQPLPQSSTDQRRVQVLPLDGGAPRAISAMIPSCAETATV
jgi:hypothetical protein